MDDDVPVPLPDKIPEIEEEKISEEPVKQVPQYVRDVLETRILPPGSKPRPLEIESLDEEEEHESIIPPPDLEEVSETSFNPQQIAQTQNPEKLSSVEDDELTLKKIKKTLRQIKMVKKKKSTKVVKAKKSAKKSVKKTSKKKTAKKATNKKPKKTAGSGVAKASMRQDVVDKLSMKYEEVDKSIKKIKQEISNISGYKIAKQTDVNKLIKNYDKLAKKVNELSRSFNEHVKNFEKTTSVLKAELNAIDKSAMKNKTEGYEIFKKLKAIESLLPKLAERSAIKEMKDVVSSLIIEVRDVLVQDQKVTESLKDHEQYSTAKFNDLTAMINDNAAAIKQLSKEVNKLNDSVYVLREKINYIKEKL